MNKILVILLLLLPLKMLSQDVLILRGGDAIVNCQIIQLSDSVIRYKGWKSSDTTIYTLKSYDVLSYQLDKKTAGNDIGVKSDYSEEGMLGMYSMGETVSGYILMSNGEKLEGFIKVKDVVASQFGVTFIDKTGQSTMYEPGKIAGFGYGKVEYESIATGYTKSLHPNYKSAGGNLFLHRIVKGQAVLYRIYRIEFNQGTLAQNPYPPLFSGRLDHAFVIRYPEQRYIVTFGKGTKSSLVTAFERHNDFVKIIQDAKIHKADIPDWVGKFNYWVSDQVKQ